MDRRSRPEGRATGRGPSNDSPRTPPIDLSSQGHLLHRQAELEPRLGVIALHPYATHDLKAWPQAHWRDLIRLLDAADRDWVVVGRSDTPLLPGHPRDLTNRTSLRALCGLLAGCAALVTGDSGPMHLATAVGTPVLALFGPTSAAWGFTPSGERDRVLELDLPCRPCSLHGKSGCGRDKECLRRIAPDRVAATLDIL